ncbi:MULTISPECIES: hypothetical protein [Paenibacillus]|uniref:hypothetical protein n=1 Tax=Paenibacillus TaxID=44249 RepID=UPI0011AAB2E0|nr:MULTISPECIES: hypothetical protein [Paenibacillus]MBJ9989285.1 hypothetical protein [Paenibacillus sp. S28]
MKKSTIISLILIVVIIIAGGIYLTNLNTSFQKVVLDHMNVDQITTLRVEKYTSADVQEVNVTDQNEIKKIMNDLSEVKLKKSNDINSDQPLPFYVITSDENGTPKFRITIRNNNTMTISDVTAKKGGTNNYKIRNDFNDESIKGLFKL